MQQFLATAARLSLYYLCITLLYIPFCEAFGVEILFCLLMAFAFFAFNGQIKPASLAHTEPVKLKTGNESKEHAEKAGKATEPVKLKTRIAFLAFMAAVSAGSGALGFGLVRSRFGRI